MYQVYVHVNVILSLCNFPSHSFPFFSELLAVKCFASFRQYSQLVKEPRAHIQRVVHHHPQWVRVVHRTLPSPSPFFYTTFCELLAEYGAIHFIEKTVILCMVSQSSCSCDDLYKELRPIGWCYPSVQAIGPKFGACIDHKYNKELGGLSDPRLPQPKSDFHDSVCRWYSTREEESAVVKKEAGIRPLWQERLG